MNLILFLVGLVIYASYGIGGMAFLAFSLLTAYVAARFVKGRKWVMILTVAVNAALLVFFKVLPYTKLTLIAPFGVSYYTFQIISYLVDVYRGKYEAERNLFWFALYVTYIPHLFSGPIERYDLMCQSLKDKRRITWQSLSDGGLRALWGAFKIFVISAPAGVLLSHMIADPKKFGEYTGAFALFAMLLYAVQLYANFSGTMDVAIGVSRIWGIGLSENFDAPYFSQSFKEFWRRWHITLGAWLRDYIYIPLGGSRCGKVRRVFNLLVTFFVSGIWHGLHYILWGLINGVFVAVGDKLKTRWKPLNIAGTFCLVTLLWAFFIWPDTVTALTMIGSVFTTFNYGALFAALPTMGLSAGGGIAFGVALILLWLFDLKRETLSAKASAFRPEAKVAIAGALTLAILLFGVYGIGFDFGGFVYTGM
ncbi:MAG: MBOAT family protein [Ruminococcaceae bacterium]|nr:MBOAT family protein [Oscillospiraceae bacterium]